MLKTYKKPLAILLVLINLSSCATIEEFFSDEPEEISSLKKEKAEEADDSKPAPVVLSEKEQMFKDAEKAYLMLEEDKAKKLYLKLTRSSGQGYDPIYDTALYRLSDIYAAHDELENALLALDELANRPSLSISIYRIKFAQLQNHFLLQNDSEALKIRQQLDNDYKNHKLGLSEIAESLIHTSDLKFNHRAMAELKYLGAIQKYYLFVIEDPSISKSEILSKVLISFYKEFSALAESSRIEESMKRNIQANVLDQLKALDLLISDESVIPTSPLGKFVQFSASEKIKLEAKLNN